MIGGFDKILDVNVIGDAMENVKSGAPAYCTNLFASQGQLTKWVKNGYLRLCVGTDAALLNREDQTFSHLYFLAASLDSLQRCLKERMMALSGTVVMDLVGALGSVAELCKIAYAAGFLPYKRLIRMKRLHSPTDLAHSGDTTVGFAKPDDADRISEMLHEAFDPLCEQLPGMDEIYEAIQNHSILIIRVEEEPGALLHFETQGRSSRIRYWLVTPAQQGKGFGSALMRHYFDMHVEVRRFTLWVREENEPAISKYQHYGFTCDNLIDQVVTLSFVS